MTGIHHDRHPLSHQQYRVWLLDRLDPGAPAFNVPFGLWLRGPLDQDALEQALDDLAERHEALRTAVVAEGDEPAMVVSAPTGLSLTRSSAVTEAEALAQAATVARHRFPLATGPLAVARLISVTPSQHLLVLVVHHIVSDGWSGSVLLRDLGDLYSARAAGRTPSLPEPGTTPGAYARWQRTELAGDGLRRHLDFWTAHLAEAPHRLDLPTDGPRPRNGSHEGAIHPFDLAPELTARVRQYARRHRVTPFMVLYTAFGALLHRYSGQERVVVGFPMANRTEPELESLVAYLSNVLPVCVDLSGDPDFSEVLLRTRRSMTEAYEFQNVPFHSLVNELGAHRDPGVNPVFQVHFAVQAFPGEPPRFHDLETAAVQVDNGTAKFDLYLSLEWRADGGMRGEVQYNSDLFTPARIDRLAGHYERLLAAAVDAGGKVAALPLLGEDERRRLLARSVTAGTVDAQLVPDAFAAVAAARPDDVAIVDGERRMTFRELEERATRLAHRLRREGVGPDRVVGVCLDRSADYVVSVLGILKAGGAFLPLDPRYPSDRLAFMVEDSRVATIVTAAGAARSLPPGAVTVMRLDELALDDEPTTPVAHGLTADHLMTVLYTSGSTGRPKGVLGTHRNWLAPIAAMAAEHPFRPGEVCCQKTPVSFVDAVWECLDPLLHGVPLVILPDDTVKDPAAFTAALAAHRVTRLVAVPSLLRLLIDAPGDLPDLTLCISSGEELTAETARRVQERLPAARLVNMYGTTEIAADVSRCTVPREADRVGIGRPIPGARVHLLDETLSLVPEGVDGELYVGGDVVARGYLDAPDLTAERFVPDPFGTGGRLYRTGDIARYRPDGNIDLLGRADRQLKIRGIRVEPGEVRKAVAGFPSVADCEVLPRTEAGDVQLVAYVRPSDEAGFDAGALLAELRRTLPAHLVPTLVTVPELPLLPNGKVDSAALAAHAAFVPASAGEFIAPRDRDETAMAGIWQKVLGVSRVGLHDNFFDLGGDSIRALRLVALANQEGFRLNAQDPLRSQTVADLVRASRSRTAEAPAANDLTVAQADLGQLARLMSRGINV
ncbi:non-ribosomal peptide synthetase [Streptomyces phaeofaciens]|uniref:non-ribosomal peptide synthetase n=1 Tax=Streptomyces phaeofaciens TaxID=68254 RepID=UPI0036AE4F13